MSSQSFRKDQGSSSKSGPSFTSSGHGTDITSSGHGTGFTSSGHGLNFTSSGHGTDLNGGMSALSFGGSNLTSSGHGTDRHGGKGGSKSGGGGGFFEKAASWAGDLWGDLKSSMATGFSPGMGGWTQGGKATPDGFGDGGWGTGLFGGATWGGKGSGEGFERSMHDLGQNTAHSGTGTSNKGRAGDMDPGKDRTYDTYGYGGVGVSGNGVGLGVGGGAGHWSQGPDSKGRSSEGYSLGGGILATQRHSGENWSVGADAYRGAGGNAYRYDRPGETGYGVDAGYTPIGVQNAEVAANGEWGSFTGGVSDVSFNKQAGSLEGGRQDDGTYVGRASWTNPKGRTQVHDVHGDLHTGLGHTHAEFGNYGKGGGYEANGYYNPETGSFGAGFKKGSTGQNGWRAAGSHTFNDGTSVGASAGSVGLKKSGWEGSAGWDAERGMAVADGAYVDGNRVKDVQAGVNGDWGGVNASMGEYRDGTRVNGHFETNGRSGQLSGDAAFGGREVKNVGTSVEFGDWYQNQTSVGSVSDNTQVQGARAGWDVDKGQVNAGVDSVRTNGVRVNDVSTHTNVGGLDQRTSLGEWSNDVKVSGVDAQLGLDQGRIQVGEVDYGGWRASDLQHKTDFGGHGSLDVSAGSFGTSDNVSGVDVQYGANGVDASVESLSLFGNDVKDAKVELQGPGGLNAGASLDAYGSGLGVKGVTAHAGPDGVNLGADEISYNQHSIEGFKSHQGIDGLFSQQSEIGRVGYNTASAKGLSTGINADGAHFGLDEASYARLGIDDVKTSVDFGEHGNASAELDRFGWMEANAKGVDARIDGSGASANVDHADFRQFGIDGARANVDLFDGAVTGSGSLDRAGVNNASVDGFRFNADANGVNAHVDKAGYSYLGVDGLKAESDIGGLKSSVNLDHFGMHEAGIENLDYSVGKDGTTRTSFENGNYSYFGVDGLNTKTDYFGVMGNEVNLGHGDFASVSAGKYESQHNLMQGTGSARVQDANARVLGLEDVSVSQNVGDAKATVGADELKVGDFNVANAQGEVSNWGATGNYQVDGARADLLKAENLGGSLSWGDQKLAGAEIDARLGGSVDKAQANWDLTTGDVSQSVENARYGGRIGGDFELLGNKLSVPQVGADLNVSANQTGNLYDAKSQGGVNLAGTNIDLGFWKGELGENANVGWNVDLNKDILSSNIDLNVAGRNIDVDQGVRDAATYVGDKATQVYEGGKAAVNYAGEQISAGTTAVVDAGRSAANWAGDKLDSAGTAIASGATAAKDWAGDKLNSAGSAISSGASAAKDWAGDKLNSAGNAISKAMPWNW